ncbi:MAG: hypothetical protein HY703_08300 [Gemmatimonadetes bacterium]|nr:hypothetical protein [Gemmatimonadota bacterium]
MPQPDWLAAEIELFEQLRSPEDVQGFLDSIPYNEEITCRSPRRVMRERKANCTEGAFFAAAALEHLGQPPRVVNLRAVRDDDHLIALFRRRGRLGAVAKSNYTGLRYRSPVYHNLRELVLSYFDHYYNPAGELTLRAYARPLDLRTRRFGQWRTSEEDLDDLADHFDRLPATVIVSAAEARRLRPVDGRLMAAGLLGAREEGLYQGPMRPSPRAARAG